MFASIACQWCCKHAYTHIYLQTYTRCLEMCYNELQSLSTLLSVLLFVVSRSSAGHAADMSFLLPLPHFGWCWLCAWPVVWLVALLHFKQCVGFLLLLSILFLFLLRWQFVEFVFDWVFPIRGQEGRKDGRQAGGSHWIPRLAPSPSIPRVSFNGMCARLGC